MALILIGAALQLTTFGAITASQTLSSSGEIQIESPTAMNSTSANTIYNYIIYADPTTGFYDVQAANGTICWSSADLSSIVNDAFSGGDSICFANGTYDVTSPLLPQSNNLIFGAGNTAFIRDPTYIGPVFDIVNVENTTIEDLTINGNENSYQFDLHGASIINSQSIIVSDNLITNTGHNGVNIINSYNCTVANNIIENTYVSGVYIQGVNSQITVSNNYISNTRDQGIDTYNTSFNVFEDNTFSDCGWGESGNCGIYLLEASNNTVNNNSITNSNGGINLEFGSDYNQVSDNIVDYNTGAGISITGNVIWFNTTSQCNFNNVCDNEAIGNTNYGVGIYNGTGNTVTGNNIQSNGQDGIIIDANSPRNTVTGNSVSSNSGYGLDLLGEYSIITGNNINNDVTFGCAVGSSYNLLSGNTFNDNAWWGIQIDKGTIANSVLSCNATQDGFGGINNLGMSSDIHLCQNGTASWIS